VGARKQIEEATQQLGDQILRAVLPKGIASGVAQ